MGMIVFPNAKINIGLFVTGRRPDGFHNLETIFFPLGLSDVLEISRIEGKSGEWHFECTGLDVGCSAENNLIVKAYQRLAADCRLPAVRIHLHKIIPFGAGLGGGSSDAAFMLKALNEYFDLHLGISRQVRYAAMLGSDCPFFIRNRPAFASGKGEVLEESDLSLKGCRIVLIKPPVAVSTVEAYAGISPVAAGFDLRSLPAVPLAGWRNFVYNDFEKTIFEKHPCIAAVKQRLYDAGACYASMSGSGSAVYGIFDRQEPVDVDCPDCFVWQENI